MKNFIDLVINVCDECCLWFVERRRQQVGLCWSENIPMIGWADQQERGSWGMGQIEDVSTRRRRTGALLRTETVRQDDDIDIVEAEEILL
mmetsp:Transcript_31321/g.67661  ORF Transcript_31321/g.67661 Transcript_31321/m.67661 type:complete len:90 (+) Transcript_31321:1281-1550(+)